MGDAAKQYIPIDYFIAKVTGFEVVSGHAIRTPADKPQWMRFVARRCSFGGGWQIDHFDSGYMLASVFGPTRAAAAKALWAKSWARCDLAMLRSMTPTSAHPGAGE